MLYSLGSALTETKHDIKVALGVPEIMQYERYLDLPSFVGKGKKSKFQLHQRESMEKVTRMGRQITISSRKGSVIEVSYTSYPHLLYGMF